MREEPQPARLSGALSQVTDLSDGTFAPLAVPAATPTRRWPRPQASATSGWQSPQRAAPCAPASPGTEAQTDEPTSQQRGAIAANAVPGRPPSSTPAQNGCGVPVSLVVPDAPRRTGRTETLTRPSTPATTNRPTHPQGQPTGTEERATAATHARPQP
jgi:hypothetical protein